jgi:hypothetical protein
MLLVLGGGCHLFFKNLGKYLLLLVVRVHVRPGKWTNTCRACRRGATGGVAQRQNIGRRHAGRRNIGWWEKGRWSAGNRPADWRGVVPAATEQRGEGEVGFSLTERARLRFSLVRSPRAHPGGPGMVWALRMDEGLNPGGNEEPGARLGRITLSG